MALSVIGMQNIDGKAMVTIRSDKDGKTPGNTFSLAITELQGSEARNLAVQYAQQTGGVTNARVEFPGAPYPVDKEGGVISNPKEQTIDHYRVDVPITQGIR